MREYIEATRFYTFEEFNRLVRDALKIPEGSDIHKIWDYHRIGSDEGEEGIYVKIRSGKI